MLYFLRTIVKPEIPIIEPTGKEAAHALVRLVKSGVRIALRLRTLPHLPVDVPLPGRILHSQRSARRHQHRARPEKPEARDDRRIVREGPVAVPFHEIPDEDAHVVERERPVRVPRDEGLLPGSEVLVDLAGDLLELVFELLDLALARGAVREALQLLEPSPHALDRLFELGLVRHGETVAKASPLRSTKLLSLRKLGVLARAPSRDPSLDSGPSVESSHAPGDKEGRVRTGAVSLL